LYGVSSSLDLGFYKPGEVGHGYGIPSRELVSGIKGFEGLVVDRAFFAQRINNYLVCKRRIENTICSNIKDDKWFIDPIRVEPLSNGGFFFQFHPQDP